MNPDEYARYALDMDVRKLEADQVFYGILGICFLIVTWNTENDYIGIASGFLYFAMLVMVLKVNKQIHVFLNYKQNREVKGSPISAKEG